MRMTQQAQSVTEGLAKELGENLETYGVRALSVTAGGGYVGVSVRRRSSPWTMRCAAELMGSVTASQNVSVRANMAHETCWRPRWRPAAASWL